LSQAAFLDKTLRAVAHVAEQTLFSEAFARRRGLLQSLDARIKLFSLFFLIMVASLARTPQVLWLLCATGLGLAALSRVPLWFFIKRVWLFVPLFSAVIVLPALFNIITPGDPLWVVLRLDQAHSWGPYTIPREIVVTRQGLWGAVIFVSRVAASVSFAVLLTLTTRWERIFAGLRALLVPRIFVMTLSMTERYLFVFLRLVQDMYRGRKSRTIRPLSSAAERGWIASRIGVTFKRSVELSNDIYRAMLSRGYQGDMAMLDRFHAGVADYLWVVTTVAFGVIIVLFERRILL
jgi:cobalt/nickel transport system permease protein